MTKQTAYLNNFARKSGFSLQFLRQSAFYTHYCWRGLMTSPMTKQSKFGMRMVENIVGKEENAAFPQCFQTATF